MWWSEQYIGNLSMGRTENLSRWPTGFSSITNGSSGASKVPSMQSRNADGLRYWNVSFLSSRIILGWRKTLQTLSTFNCSQYRNSIHLVGWWNCGISSRNVYPMHEPGRLHWNGLYYSGRLGLCQWSFKNWSWSRSRCLSHLISQSITAFLNKKSCPKF